MENLRVIREALDDLIKTYDRLIDVSHGADCDWMYGAGTDIDRIAGLIAKLQKSAFDRLRTAENQLME